MVRAEGVRVAMETGSGGVEGQEEGGLVWGKEAGMREEGGGEILEAAPVIISVS